MRWPFSSRSNFGAGTKGLSSTWPEIGVVVGPLYSRLVIITNCDKRGSPNGSIQQLLPPDFSLRWSYDLRLKGT
jgi:hypothetical protein